MIGSMIHMREIYDGKSVDTLELAFEMIQENLSFFDGLVIHKYSIEEHRTAFSIAAKGKNNAIKVHSISDRTRNQ